MDKDQPGQDSTAAENRPLVVISKCEANRIAAAKVYVKARRKAGLDVPAWIERLAARCW